MCVCVCVWGGGGGGGVLDYSLIPIPHHLYTSVCVDNNNNTWKQKRGEKWEKPGSIHYVDDTRWTQGGNNTEGERTNSKHCTRS